MQQIFGQYHDIDFGIERSKENGEEVERGPNIDTSTSVAANFSEDSAEYVR